jgi:hypothetical protein
MWLLAPKVRHLAACYRLHTRSSPSVGRGNLQLHTSCSNLISAKFISECVRILTSYFEYWHARHSYVLWHLTRFTGLVATNEGNACKETNLMHYLSSVYSVTIPLHVSGLLVAYYQEVTMYICNTCWVGTGPTSTRPTDSRLKRTTRTICCIYTLLPPDNRQLATPKHVDVYSDGINWR